MIINDAKTIKEVKSEFNTKFPFLKLEFYTKPHGVGEGSAAADTLDDSLTIAVVRQIHNTGDISINANQKVSTLENNFLKTYGLSVQVFYRSGQTWFQTTATDNWTLAEQVARATRNADFKDTPYTVS